MYRIRDTSETEVMVTLIANNHPHIILFAVHKIASLEHESLERMYAQSSKLRQVEPWGRLGQ